MRKQCLTLLTFVLCISLLTGCTPGMKQSTETLFALLPSNQTGIKFNNKITTSDSVNVLSYEYLYNGGGVGIGDFNNDSLPDVFFTGNMVPCKLYINKKNFRFEDVTEKSRINTEGIWSYGVSIIDINQD